MKLKVGDRVILTSYGGKNDDLHHYLGLTTVTGTIIRDSDIIGLSLYFVVSFAGQRLICKEDEIQLLPDIFKLWQ